MGEDNQSGGNLANRDIDYKIVEGKRGKWKVFVYDETGASYREYTSNRSLAGWPLVHITLGKNPETGSRKTAMGIIAIGRFAVGFIAIGQVAAGIITLAQAGLGMFFLGQAGLGYAGIGQVVVCYEFALGQLAVAKTAIGQFAVGQYALGQLAFGSHAWSPKVQDPEAVHYFTNMWNSVKSFLGW